MEISRFNTVKKDKSSKLDMVDLKYNSVGKPGASIFSNKNSLDMNQYREIGLNSSLANQSDKGTNLYKGKYGTTQKKQGITFDTRKLSGFKSNLT